jgi:2-dehydro-3-deoxygalactonokinase
MSAAQFIAADWGTTHLRLFLCDAEGVAQDSTSGPGAAEVRGPFGDVFASLTARWEERHGVLPAVLCGMVGSSIGWTQAPYVPCPAHPDQIIAACTPLEGGRIQIVPGLSCRNRFNAPDLLRGEETQILGALRLEDTLRQGRWILCLPGTHTKWVVVEDGWVREFVTAPAGELFALLRDRSVLVRKPPGVDDQFDPETFAKGLANFNEFPEAQVLHRLFECRSRQLSGEFEAHAASSYLSGMLIASDVHGALRMLSSSATPRTVFLVGSPQLTQLYATACVFSNYDTHQVDGAAASLAGLTQVYRRLSKKDPAYGI